MAAKKKPSGENIPEAMRKTEAIKVRLSPRSAQRLRSFAFEHGWSISKTVGEALKALERELQAEFERNEELSDE